MKSKRSLTACDLADQCEVSERTIHKDIQTLSEAKVPIYFNDGYRLRHKAFLPPLNLSADELLSLYVGLNSYPVQSVNCFRKSAKRALAKLESLIPENTRPAYEKAKEHIKVQPEKPCSHKGADLMFQFLGQALWPEKKIKLHYVSPLSSEQVELTPRALLYKRGSWYLEGVVQSKIRDFRLDMIKNVSLT